MVVVGVVQGVGVPVAVPGRPPPLGRIVWVAVLEDGFSGFVLGRGRLRVWSGLLAREDLCTCAGGRYVRCGERGWSGSFQL